MVSWSGESFFLLFLGSVVFGFGFAIGGTLWGAVLSLLGRGAPPRQGI